MASQYYCFRLFSVWERLSLPASYFPNRMRWNSSRQIFDDRRLSQDLLALSSGRSLHCCRLRCCYGNGSTIGTFVRPASGSDRFSNTDSCLLSIGTLCSFRFSWRRWRRSHRHDALGSWHGSAGFLTKGRINKRRLRCETKHGIRGF